jgi:putative ABC transport system substrate-binding protein
MVPTGSTVALLINLANPTAENIPRDMQVAANGLGLKLHLLSASTERELDTVFASLGQVRAGALLIGTDAFFTSRSEQLGELTVRHAVPAIYQTREFTEAGGLMNYGGNVPESHRVGGAYVGRILKGERPADLPVRQATRVELVINLKTAKVLGLTVPITLLGRADEVIE